MTEVALAKNPILLSKASILLDIGNEQKENENIEQ